MLVKSRYGWLLSLSGEMKLDRRACICREQSKAGKVACKSNDDDLSGTHLLNIACLGNIRSYN